MHPRREGTYFINQVLHRFDAGTAEAADMDLLKDLCAQIMGRSFCALGDAAATPTRRRSWHFADEFAAGTHTPSDQLFDPVRTTVFAPVEAR